MIYHLTPNLSWACLVTRTTSWSWINTVESKGISFLLSNPNVVPPILLPCDQINSKALIYLSIIPVCLKLDNFSKGLSNFHSPYCLINTSINFFYVRLSSITLKLNKLNSGWIGLPYSREPTWLNWTKSFVILLWPPG